MHRSEMSEEMSVNDWIIDLNSWLIFRGPTNNYYYTLWWIPENVADDKQHTCFEGRAKGLMKLDLTGKIWDTWNKKDKRNKRR